MRFGIDAKILKSIASVFARHPSIVEARVYGSRARGDFKPGSDLDIALFAPELSFDEFLRVRGELDDLPCLYTLDTVHLDDLKNEGLRKAIRADGQAFYARQATTGDQYPADEPAPLFVREDFPEYG
jgi:predicted nucleotidyltransferase